MTQQELRRLARIGAEARLEMLQREVAAIYQVFPDLRRGRSTPNPYTAGVRGAVDGAVTRRRPRLSREARQRIAEAQRKRWAAWKATQEKTEAGDGAASRVVAGGRSRKKK